MATDFSLVPNLEYMVMERLKHCALDIGAVRAEAIPPKQAFVKEDLPAVYNMIGGTFTAQLPDSSSGLVVSAVTYTQRWIIAPFASGVQDTENGYEMYVKCLPYFTKVNWYYSNHKMLNTTLAGNDANELPLNQKLPYCRGILPAPDESPLVRHNGITEAQVVAGGGQYACIDFRLNIIMMMDKRRS